MISNKWQTRDYILVAVLSVVFSMLFAISGIATVIFGGITHIFAPAISGFFGAIIYLLILAKVPKTGVFTLSSFVILVIMYLTGHTFLPLLLSIFFGAIFADLICMTTRYQKFWSLATGFTVFMNAQMLGTIIPIMFFANHYLEYSASKPAKAQETSLQIIDFITPINAIFLLLITSFACLGGIFIAKKLLHKHFAKAGKLN